MWRTTLTRSYCMENSELSFIDTSITQMKDMKKRIEHLSLRAVAVLTS